MSFRAVDELVVDPAGVRCYTEGWQSWSPTGWRRPDEQARPGQPWEQVMRFRPGAPVPDGVLQAEGLLVVDPGTGGPATSYALAVPAGEVPTLRARLDGDRLLVTADGPVVTAGHADPGVAPAEVGDTLAAAARVGGLAEPPRVWCTWYHYFERVTAADVTENLDGLDAHGLPVDVVQVDDGWSRGLGEGLAPAPGFGDLARLVDRIRSTGRRAGVWLAPFLVGARTTLAREHPDWLTGDAGLNWGQPLRGLDLTHAGVRELLDHHVRRLAGLGVDYLKLDFLYAGALPGQRHDDVSAVAAYRSGLALLREAAGPDAILLGCGAPVFPSVGLVDAMRVSPDTFHAGGEDGSRGLRGRPATVARAWQQGRLWVNDPDCLVVRPSYRLREEWAATVRRYGGLRSCSDRVADLDAWGLAETRALLQSPVPPRPFSSAAVAAAHQEAAP